MDNAWVVYINGARHLIDSPTEVLNRDDGAILLDVPGGALRLCRTSPVCKRLNPTSCQILRCPMQRPGLIYGPDDWDDEESQEAVTPVNYRVICHRLNNFFEDHGYGRPLVENGRSHYLNGGNVRGREFRKSAAWSVIVIDQEVARV